ncbi:hypothetical protein [Apilactobacillus xinyiensis]|uniref:hypothetical protein n=1 Tax=Apilactobacillus xinyiensis TaxID=2841032 RepID=UPI00200F0AF4|nr:hypothetical protein [Apilactobacillus xinyiensis]MCL0330573.1 hypothetical protein [Apilactobacillus xinyiensis]
MEIDQTFDYTDEPLIEYGQYLHIGCEYIPDDIYILKLFIMHEFGYREDELVTDESVMQALKDNQSYEIIEVNSYYEDNYREINQTLPEFFGNSLTDYFKTEQTA